MKILVWRIIVFCVIIIFLISFLVLFQEGTQLPRFLSLPYIFWNSILMTVLLVILTFIGARNFPFKDEQEL